MARLQHERHLDDLDGNRAVATTERALANLAKAEGGIEFFGVKGRLHIRRGVASGLDAQQGIIQQTCTNALPRRVTPDKQLGDFMAVDLDETLKGIGVRQPEVASGDGLAIGLG